MECPHCGSHRVKCTNLDEKIIAGTVGTVAGVASAFALSALSCGAAAPAGLYAGWQVAKNMHSSSYYKCKTCGHEFSGSPW